MNRTKPAAIVAAVATAAAGLLLASPASGATGPETVVTGLQNPRGL